MLKEAPPYSPELEAPVLLNPLARASKDATGSYSYPKKPEHLPSKMTVAAKTASIAATLTKKYDGQAGLYGVGTDVEMISAVPNSEVFLEKNFSTDELAYCRAAPDFQASLAGRWTAKEAVFKALKTDSKGAGASMKDIEIVSTPNGPKVHLHGDAKKIADAKAITDFELSITVSNIIFLYLV